MVCGASTERDSMIEKTSVRFRLVSLVIAFALAQFPAHGQAPVFTKTLKKVNGVPIASPPALLTNGDVLDWVISYKFDHDPAQPAQANIQDMLSPPLQYVPGSLQAPPSWTKQWLDGTKWVTAEPSAAGGAGATVNVRSVGAIYPLPAPPLVSISTNGNGGDGYRAIPYKDQVYVVNHHVSGQYLNCFDVTTGTPCQGYAAHVPLSPGISYIGNNNLDNLTALKPIEYLDRSNGRLYFPVVTTANDLGILCADLSTKTSCGYYSFSTPSTSGIHYGDISGIGGIGGRVYAQLRDGSIGCLDTTGSTPKICALSPYKVLTAYNRDVQNSSSVIIGARIYSLWQGSASAQPFLLSCFDTVSSSLCAGWGSNPKIPDPAGTNGILYPLLDADGKETGICTHTTGPVGGSSALNCYDLSTGAVIPAAGISLPNPSNYLQWVQAYGGGQYQYIGEGQTGWFRARVFNGDTAAKGAIGCYDFAASPPGPCVQFPVKGPNITKVHYETIADPERPGCMWSYGDDGILGSFKAADGSPCSSTTTLDKIVEPALSYCAGGIVSGWGQISVTGLTLGGGITATLTLYDGSHPTSLALQPNGAPYAQDLVVNSFPFSLQGIGYGTGPGQYRSLRVVLTFNGISDPSPWSKTPPPSAEVTWAGDPPQLCFQTKVATCIGQFVTNQATAVTTPSSGAQITNMAPIPAFNAAHVLDPSCPSSCLEVINEKVLCATDGSKDYIYTFQVTNHSTIPAYHLLLIDLPSPATATPNDVTFGPEGGFLAPGKTSQVKTVRIHGAHAGTFSIRLGLFDQNVRQCCATTAHALVLPDCDCAQVISDVACGMGSSFSYIFNIQNLTKAPPVSYALVTSATPDLMITQSGAPLVPPLGYGSTTKQTVTFSGPAAKVGATVCFTLSVHDASLLKCCSINRCVILRSLFSSACILPHQPAADLNLSLSTGLNTAAAASPGAQGNSDLNWTMTVPGPARPAEAVSSPDSDWPWAIPGTAWISRESSGDSAAGTSAVRYRRCFCIGAGAQKATLNLSLWADDRASLLLNGRLIAGPGGNYADPRPLSVHLTGAVGSGGPFTVGANCLVAVVHESGDTTGLNIFGSVQAAGGTCTSP